MDPQIPVMAATRGRGRDWREPQPSSPDDIWIVGTADRIWHFDGETLTSMPSGEPEDGAHSIEWNAVYGSSPTDVWAVGTWVKRHTTTVSNGRP